jgi:predicted HTH transcriptional regulator
MAAILQNITDVELISRASNFEDQFTERKTYTNSKGWIETVVAFANSCPIGFPGVLYIGLKDDGTPQPPINLDTAQKTFAENIKAIYPPVYCLPRVITIAETQVLAILVPGSPNRPHFTGKSYVRVGSTTNEASETQFASLIAQRSSPVYEILKWQGKSISFHLTEAHGDRPHQGAEFTVEDCNSFFVTLHKNGQSWSYALSRVTISFDHKHQRLVIGVDYR